MKKILVALIVSATLSGIVLPYQTNAAPTPQTIAEVASELQVIKGNVVAIQQVEMAKLATMQSLVTLLGSMKNELTAIQNLPEGNEKTTRIQLASTKVQAATQIVATLSSITTKENEIIKGLVAETQALASRLQ